MFSGEIWADALVAVLCYVYILTVIFVSSKIHRTRNLPQKDSRKFLHTMIGNLVFIIPFFTAPVYPVLVAAPFILVTFLATPYSPFKRAYKRLSGLANITEEGHHLGLVFYSISFTTLAIFLPSSPLIIAAGILPMAYGDSAASAVGERYGKKRYKTASKSVEGSLAMFAVSFLSLMASFGFFSMLYPISVTGKILPAVVTATVATVAEGLSPSGFDNLTVPLLSALAFLLVGGGSY